MGNQSVTSLLSPVFLLMAFASAVSAQTVKASVDRDALHLGETVKFTIKWSGPNPESSVNLEALRKDFNVLGTSQSNQIKMFEGRTTITTELIITLEPKYAGTMEIPSIQVGRHKTPPLPLMVLPNTQQGQQGDDRDRLLYPSFVQLDLMYQGNATNQEKKVIAKPFTNSWPW